MVIDAITTLILQWCEADKPQYSKLQKEECSLYIANCVIDFEGKLIQEEVRLTNCINNGKRRLNVQDSN